MIWILIFIAVFVVIVIFSFWEDNSSSSTSTSTASELSDAEIERERQLDHLKNAIAERDAKKQELEVLEKHRESMDVHEYESQHTRIIGDLYVLQDRIDLCRRAFEEAADKC